jgi:signal transduction histidine kinase
MRDNGHVADAAGPQSARSVTAQRAATAAAAAVVTALVSLATVLGSANENPATSVERGLAPWLVALGLSGVAFVVVAAWLVWAQHPHASIGLAVMTVGLLLPLWAGWSWLPVGVRGGVQAAGPLAVAGTAHVALRWRSGTRQSWTVTTVYLLTVVGALVHLAGYDPFEDPGCVRTCADTRPVADDVVSTRSAVAITGLLTVTAATVAALATWRTRRRGVPRQVVVAALAAIAALAAGSALRPVRWNVPPSADMFVVLQAGAALAVGGAVCAVTVRRLRTRMAVDRLVRRLSHPEAAPGDLRGAIRAVHFSVPGDERWIDSAGRDVGDGPRAGGSVVISDASGPVLRLVVATGKYADDVLAALTPADRLSLRNAQLSAVTKARLTDVQASRRRIVATSDTERRRIEHDLHDGAQQRLVSAAFYLSLARSKLPPDSDRLSRAEATVRDALTNLRHLSHGLFPGVLATEGLPAALDELVKITDMVTMLEVRDCGAVGAEAAMAAYATVAAALDQAARTTNATSAQVSAIREEGTLTVRVEMQCPTAQMDDSDFGDVADRVGALGGRLNLSSNDNRTVVMAVLPCGS